MQFIDTHCHLDQVEFDNDRQNVIERAAQRGIVIISSAISVASYEKTLDIARAHKNVFSSLGLDPLVSREVDACLKLIKEYAFEIIAIGETGLDYYLERNHGNRHEQETAFKKMIEISNELKLPVQVHSRSAGSAALSLLEKSDAQNVHMHAFDGKAKLARRATQELGYYFSIPTSVVHSIQKRKLVKEIEIERLLLETDSPVLGPDRGVRNEPTSLPIALAEIAAILDREREELREIVLENTLRLYTRIRDTQYNS